MFLHAFNTWVVANLLHPLMIFGFAFFIDGHSGTLFYNDLFKDFLLLLMISFLFSLPCLLIGWLLVGTIVLSNYTPFTRFVMWFACSCGLVLAEIFIIAIIVKEPVDPEILSFAIPGILAVCTAITIRYKQFQNLIYSLQDNDHENDLG